MYARPDYEGTRGSGPKDVLRGMGGSGAWVGRVDGGIEKGGGAVGRVRESSSQQGEQETAKQEEEAAAGDEEDVVMGEGGEQGEGGGLGTRDRGLGTRDKSEEIKSTEMAVCLARAISGGMPGIGQVFVYLHARTRTKGLVRTHARSLARTHAHTTHPPTHPRRQAGTHARTLARMDARAYTCTGAHKHTRARARARARTHK
jgi:hypothetical protein